MYILWTFLGLAVFLIFIFRTWFNTERKYVSSVSVSSAYDAWTNDQLLEKLWGEHVHLGYYYGPSKKNDFRKAKVDFVHELVSWSGLDQLPVGSRILDVGCGIGGSARILAKEYGFDVLGISISNAQIKRAKYLTQDQTICRFDVMNALNLKFEKGSFDGVWSVEAGPHMPNKQLYADEMLRVLRPGGVLAVADWNRRDPMRGEMSNLERFVMHQLLNQWAHPEFASIEGFRRNLLNSPYSGGNVETADWTSFTIPSWFDSIWEGVRRPTIFLELGPEAFLKGLREIPTILLMDWAFRNGIMQFGVFRTRG